MGGNTAHTDIHIIALNATLRVPKSIQNCSIFYSFDIFVIFYFCINFKMMAIVFSNDAKNSCFHNLKLDLRIGEPMQICIHRKDNSRKPVNHRLTLKEGPKVKSDIRRPANWFHIANF